MNKFHGSKMMRMIRKINAYNVIMSFSLADIHGIPMAFSVNKQKAKKTSKTAWCHYAIFKWMRFLLFPAHFKLMKFLLQLTRWPSAALERTYTRFPHCSHKI